MQLGSQSEPDLNAARRRRKRVSKKKVKSGALGPREEIHRSNCAHALLCTGDLSQSREYTVLTVRVGRWMRSGPHTDVQPTGALRWWPFNVDWRTSGQRKDGQYRSSQRGDAGAG